MAGYLPSLILSKHIYCPNSFASQLKIRPRSILRNLDLTLMVNDTQKYIYIILICIIENHLAATRLLVLLQLTGELVGHAEHILTDYIFCTIENSEQQLALLVLLLLTGELVGHAENILTDYIICTR